MDRLTYELAGNVCIKGVDAEDCSSFCKELLKTNGRTFKTCHECPINQSFQLLHTYEDTGLTPEEIPHWISVSERLPNKNDANKDSSILAIHKSDTKQYWHWKSVADNPFDFAFWMPVPKPPEGEKP